MIYCKWCGNNGVNEDDMVCEECQALLKGRLESAMDAFTLIADHYGVCCRGIRIHSRTSDRPAEEPRFQLVLPDNLLKKLTEARITEVVDASCLYVHPKGGEASNATTSVECGVNLYSGFARCYWIFDSDRASFSEGREYGPEISYQLGGEDFMKAVDAVLDQAAEYAAECGVMSCQHCGDHYHEDFPCDCQKEESEERDDE
jgi:hypothetical protein